MALGESNIWLLGIICCRTVSGEWFLCVRMFVCVHWNSPPWGCSPLFSDGPFQGAGPTIWPNYMGHMWNPLDVFMFETYLIILTFDLRLHNFNVLGGNMLKFNSEYHLHGCFNVSSWQFTGWLGVWKIEIGKLSPPILKWKVVCTPRCIWEKLFIHDEYMNT